jgi:hypothetical protein
MQKHKFPFHMISSLKKWNGAQQDWFLFGGHSLIEFAIGKQLRGSADLIECC